MSCSQTRCARIFSFLFVLFSLSVGLCGQGLADPTAVAELQTKINAQGARWVAAETDISKLPLDDAELMSNTNIVGEPSVAAGKPMAGIGITTIVPTVSLPTSLDYRTYSYVTPVKNQGSCGSCWAFASLGALESQLLMTDSVTRDLSEQTLLSCSASYTCATGGSISVTANFLKNTGVPLESCFPYTATDNLCTNACSGWASSDYKISAWHYAGATAYLPSVTELKTALAVYGPLVTTLSVYSDFDYYSSGIYSHVSGSYLGGHAVVLVGYNDASQYFIAKNSWGTSWGESGYFRIAYSEVASVVGFGSYSIAYNAAVLPSTCTYTTTSSAATATAAGGTGSIPLTASGTSCAWTAASNATWITITSATSGTGSATISYSVAANTTGSSRVGTMSIAGGSYTVTQAAGSASYVISPTAATAVYGAATGSIAVTASPTTATWTAVSNATWITVTSGASGTGSGSVTYTVAANPTTAKRSGTLTVAGKTFTLTQNAAPTYTISPTSASVARTAVTGAVTVTTTTGAAWTAASNASWITVTTGASGSGSGTVAYSVAANTAATQRTGTLTIAGSTFTLTQDAAASSYSISPTAATAAATATTGSVTVSATTGAVWSVASNASWLTITSGSSGTGAGTITYSVAANTAVAKRMAVLTITQKSTSALAISRGISFKAQAAPVMSFTLTQAAAAATYSIAPTSASPASSATSGTIAVTATTSATWTAVSSASWIKIVSGASGLGNGTVTYTVAANTTGSKRVGTITVAGKTFTVTQN